MKMMHFMTIAALLVAAAACATPSHGGGKSHDASHAWLGVSVSDVTAKLAKELGLEKSDGAYVRDVMDESPADSAGIKEGDVIVEFNGKRVGDADELVNAVRKAEAGSKVRVAVVRKGERKELWAHLKKQPRRRLSMAFVPPDLPRKIRIFKGQNSVGLSLIPLNPQLGKYFEVPEGKGLLVEKVKEGSRAEKSGFQAGDVIIKVGDKSVAKVHEFRSELAEYDEGEKASVEILRKGSRKTLTVEIPKHDEEGFDFSFGDEFPGVPDRIEMDIPDLRDFQKYRMEFDDMRPELDRLQMEIDRLKERLGDGARELKEKLIRELRDRRVMSEI